MARLFGSKVKPLKLLSQMLKNHSIKTQNQLIICPFNCGCCLAVIFL